MLKNITRQCDVSHAWYKYKNKTLFVAGYLWEFKYVSTSGSTPKVTQEFKDAFVKEFKLSYSAMEIFDVSVKVSTENIITLKLFHFTDLKNPPTPPLNCGNVSDTTNFIHTVATTYCNVCRMLFADSLRSLIDNQTVKVELSGTIDQESSKMLIDASEGNPQKIKMKVRMAYKCGNVKKNIFTPL